MLNTIHRPSFIQYHTVTLITSKFHSFYPYSSSIGQRYPRKRSLKCFMLCLILIITTAGLIVRIKAFQSSLFQRASPFQNARKLLYSVPFLSLQAGTWLNARQYKGIYASWVFFILLVLFTLFRALHWACMKISEPLQNYSQKRATRSRRSS